MPQKFLDLDSLGDMETLKNRQEFVTRHSISEDDWELDESITPSDLLNFDSISCPHCYHNYSLLSSEYSDGDSICPNCGRTAGEI